MNSLGHVFGEAPGLINETLSNKKVLWFGSQNVPRIGVFFCPLPWRPFSKQLLLGSQNVLRPFFEKQRFWIQNAPHGNTSFWKKQLSRSQNAPRRAFLCWKAEVLVWERSSQGCSFLKNWLFGLEASIAWAFISVCETVVWVTERLSWEVLLLKKQWFGSQSVLRKDIFVLKKRGAGLRTSLAGAFIFVKSWGWVLEHPSRSSLLKKYGLDLRTSAFFYWKPQFGLRAFLTRALLFQNLLLGSQSFPYGGGLVWKTPVWVAELLS